MAIENVPLRVLFQTALEEQHLFSGPEEEEPALIINPAAQPAALVAAASARAQALSDNITSHMMGGSTGAPAEETMRAMDHLADELELLLYALGKMLKHQSCAEVAPA